MLLVEGTTANVQTIVAAEMTAAIFARRPGERYPEVLATPYMIGEMERAAAAVLEPLLQEGQLSVGAKVEVSHFAPTPVGALLTSHARFVSQEGGIFWFDVWAEDPGGTVGKGRHGRAIVEATAITHKAASRRR